MTISNSSFTGNRTDYSAGAIYADGGTVNITNSSFVKNCAVRFEKLLTGNNASGSTKDDRDERMVDSDGCLHITYYRARIESDVDEDGDGGAIRLLNSAQGTIENSSFSENKATNGGAIATSSAGVSLTVNSSSFSENSTSSSAGAIYSYQGTTDVSGSSFVKNAADIGGGAIAVTFDRLGITNSTFSENQTESGAGALEIGGKADAIVSHVTFMGNWSLYRDSSTIKKQSGGKLYLRNSIVDSGGRAEDCVGGFTQNIGNLSPDGTCSIKASDDPLLGELSGSPAYYPLLDHSPALDAADPAYCPESDQVGTARPESGCDIGAIESTMAELAPVPVVPPPACSLADKIIAANTDREFEGCPAGSGADTITLSRNILLFAPLPAITTTITIEGNGYTISGNRKFRIFDVDRGYLTINNLTMIEGRTSSGRGGAIRLQNRGRAIVNNSSFIENSADVGGAVAVVSSFSTHERLVVSNSHFIRNRAGRTGGAINLDVGSAAITNSSFLRNRAGHSGGAINLLNYPRIEVTNSTFIGDLAGWDGSALAAENGATATLTHVTVYNSVASGSGSAIHQYESSYGSANTVNVRNSIVAGAGFMTRCIGTLSQNIGNLIQGGSCSPMLSDDPLLEDLTGTPEYLALQAGSPAIRAADPRFCPETDQIGRVRPLLGACDIGAIESIPVSQALSECTVTTTHGLNLRDAPSGSIIGAVPPNEAHASLARTPGWFQVDKEGTRGWISADYVVTEGDCG